MNLAKAISPDCVRLQLSATSKDGVIEELVDLLCDAGKIRNRKPALKAVFEREKKLSTGMRDGIAIPHGKSDEVDRLVAAVGLVPEGVEFDSMDKKPAKIIVLTVSPAQRTGPHIQFLGDINRLLIDDLAREKILACTSVGELHAFITAPPPVLDEEVEDDDDDLEEE